MKEKKKHIDPRLSQLPTYTPPDELWDGIEQSLHQLQQEAPLHSALQRLPTYEPPAQVWSAVEQALPEARNVVTFTPRKIAGIAAAIALLVGALLWLPTASQNEHTLAYRTETVDKTLLERDWHTDETAFTAVMQMCEQQSFTCQQPDFVVLRSELNELNDAKLMLQEALGEYGTDTDLMAQLTDIERQRTRLIKTMAQRLMT